MNFTLTTRATSNLQKLARRSMSISDDNFRHSGGIHRNLSLADTELSVTSILGDIGHVEKKAEKAEEVNLCRTIIKGLILVILAFVLFGLIISVYGQKTGDLKESESSGSLGLNEDDGGCPTLARLQINNQVCDEIANVPECMFDGWDCCLENDLKSGDNIKFCEDCRCKFQARTSEIMTIDSFNISSFPFNDDKAWLYASRHVTYFEVMSVDVCTHLCLFKEANDIDAWTFNIQTGVCQCIHMISRTLCKSVVVDKTHQDSRLFVKQTEITLKDKCNDFMLVIGGYGQHHLASDNAEAVAFNSSISCNETLLPTRIVYMTVSKIYDDVPILCGGLNGTVGHSLPLDVCFHLFNHDIKVRMIQPRYKANSVMTGKEQFLIMGGIGATEQTESEMIGLRTKETKGSQAGPVVPFLDKIESPCFAMINDTIGLLIDGYHYFDDLSGKTEQASLHYDVSSDRWSVATKIPNVQYNPACGAFSDIQTDFRIVASIGASRDQCRVYKAGENIQLWKQENEEWIFGPQLPVLSGILDSPGVAVSPDGYYLYIVGGTEGYLKEDTYVTSNIFKMQCENYDCTLDTTGLHLKDVRRASTVIFVKEHWLQCYYE